jgi:hypothetical protein
LQMFQIYLKTKQEKIFRANKYINTFKMAR